MLTAYNGVSTGVSNGKITSLNGKAITYYRQGLVYDAGDTHFSYDTFGRRIKKTTNSVATKFYYAGDMLVGQKTGSNKIEFLFDANGDYYGFEYNDVLYYYVKNLQGDVIAIANSAGNILVRYYYDAWGRLISSTDTSSNSIGTINPIRYRGYYYDTETGFYYLKTRYYSPELCRFLSPDALIDNRSVNTQNLFAYCMNNPINNIDIQGTMTVGLFLNGNLTVGVGASISIGFVIDDKGNFDIQYSYSLPKSNSTAHVGAIDIGGGLALQVTKAETVHDLLGAGTCIGASGGDLIYAGMDLISLSEITDFSDDFDGVQFTVGYGFGVDVHITQTYTRSLFDEPQNLTTKQVNKYTLMEKRMHGEVM